MCRKCRAGMCPQCTQLACAIRPVLFCRSTWKPRDDRDEYLQSLRMTYTSTAYSLFHRNCNDFSNDFSTFLTGSGIPVRPPPAGHSCPALSYVGLSLDLTVHSYVLCACKTVHCSGHTAMATFCCCLGVKLALYGIHCFDVYVSDDIL